MAQLWDNLTYYKITISYETTLKCTKLLMYIVTMSGLDLAEQIRNFVKVN